MNISFNIAPNLCFFWILKITFHILVTHILIFDFVELFTHVCWAQGRTIKERTSFVSMTISGGGGGEYDFIYPPSFHMKTNIENCR